MLDFFLTSVFHSSTCYWAVRSLSFFLVSIHLILFFLTMLRGGRYSSNTAPPCNSAHPGHVASLAVRGGAVWLLNISGMAYGTWPTEVPKCVGTDCPKAFLTSNGLLPAETKLPNTSKYHCVLTLYN